MLSVKQYHAFICCVCVQFIRMLKLYHLDLSYCEKLTDMSLERLSGSFICSLDISGCNIQDQVLFHNFLKKGTGPGGEICNLLFVFLGPGNSWRSSLEEVSTCRVYLRHEHWHRGTKPNKNFDTWPDEAFVLNNICLKITSFCKVYYFEQLTGNVASCSLEKQFHKESLISTVDVSLAVITYWQL